MKNDLPEDAEDYEQYFHIQASKSTKTAATNKEFLGAFDRGTNTFDSETPFDPAPYEPQYMEWLALSKHFSLLFNGFGSKIELLHHFGQNFLSKYGTVIEIDGYSGQPHLIQATLTELAKHFRIREKVDFSGISNFLDGLIPSEHLFIIIHSIESECLSDPESQSLLLSAANLPHISIICSIARPPFFNVRFLTGMHFAPIVVNLQRSYSKEIGYASSSKSATVIDSIDRYSLVLGTLTENARQVYLILAKHQVKEGSGFLSSEWIDRAQTELCLRLQTAFPVQVNEFMDHKLITKKDEVYSIPLAHSQLVALISKLDPTFVVDKE